MALQLTIMIYTLWITGMRPVTYAAWQGLIEPVNILLQSGADSNLPSKEGETPLHFSCQHGHVEVVCGQLRTDYLSIFYGFFF